MRIDTEHMTDIDARAVEALTDIHQLHLTARHLGLEGEQ